MTTIHTIAETFGRHLQPSEGWLTERLTGYLSQIETGLHEYTAAVNKAGQVDPNLKDEPRARKQHEILKQARQAFKKRAEQALEEIRSGQIQAAEALRARVQPRQAETSIEKLHDLLLAQEIRAELKSMTTDEKMAVLRESVRNGDRTLLDAVKGPVKPLINSHGINGLEEVYAQAVAEQELYSLEQQTHIVQTAEGLLKNAERHLSHLEQQEDRLLDPPDIRADLSGWSDADKTAFISEHGRDAWVKVLNGDAQPEDFQAATE